MKKIIFAILCVFSFCLNVFSSELRYSSEYMNPISSYDVFSINDLNFFNNFFNEYYSSQSYPVYCFLSTYIDSSKSGEIYCTVINTDNKYYLEFPEGHFEFASFNNYGGIWYRSTKQNVFTFDLINQSISFSYVTSDFSTFSLKFKEVTNLTFNYPLWLYTTNHDGVPYYDDYFTFLNGYGHDLYFEDTQLLNRRYFAKYNFDYVFSFKTQPIYSICDLVLGADQEFVYYVYYYFDDVLNSDYTQTLTYTGQVGDRVVLNNLEDNIDGFNLLSDIDYFFIVSDDSSNNYINVYYRSNMYGKQYYNINIYFDDIFQPQYSFTSYGSIGDLVDLTGFDSYENYYFADISIYNFIINSDRDQNNFNIYYYSEKYGTEYQDINTKDSKFYLFIHYDDLKDLFPSIKWDTFNQFQQFLILITINILFCVFLIFMFILVYRLLSKLFSYIW